MKMDTILQFYKILKIIAEVDCSSINELRNTMDTINFSNSLKNDEKEKLKMFLYDRYKSYHMDPLYENDLINYDINHITS